MKKMIIGFLILTSIQLFAKGVLCTLTDSVGNSVTKVGGFQQNLKSTFLHFGRVDGYDISVTGATSPKTPKEISIVAQIHEFTSEGVRTSLSTAKNQLSLNFGRTVYLKQSLKTELPDGQTASNLPTDAEAGVTEGSDDAAEAVNNEQRATEEFNLKLECSAS